MAKKGELTPKQRLFVQEYCIDKNASAAARRAGYSPKTAFRTGQQNMQKNAIRSEIAKSLDRSCSKLKITQDRLLAEEARLAFADLGGLVDDEGNPLPINELPEDLRRCVSGLIIEEHKSARSGDITRRYKYKFNDKGAALLRLEKINGMIVEKIQIDMKCTIEHITKLIAEICEPEQVERISSRLSELAEAGARN